MSHGPEHERLLERILTGDLDPVPPEVVSELRGCARCVPTWDEVARLQAELSRAGRRRRGVLASARESAGAPGEAQVMSLFRERLPETSRAVPERRPWRGAPWAIAAALLLALLVGRWVVTREDRGRDMQTLGPRIEGLAPTNRASRETLYFSWRSPLPPGTLYRVVVEGRVDGGQWTPVDEVDLLRESGWLPERDAVATWPDDLRWRVIAYDASGEGHLGTSEWSPWSLLP